MGAEPQMEDRPPKRSEEDDLGDANKRAKTEGGQEEADDTFWNVLEGADAKEVPAPKPRRLAPLGGSKFEVPEESCQELLRKSGAIQRRSKASLQQDGISLQISGDREQRKLAQRLASLVVQGKIDEDQPDVTVLCAGSEWLETWRGTEAQLEKEMDVLVLFEDERQRTGPWQEGEVMEAQKDGTGRWGLATVLALDGPRRVQLRWSSDAAVEVVDVSHTRPARRIGIVGTRRGRLGAEVGILTAMEGAARGSMAVLLSARAAYGGTCLSSIELPIRAATMWKLEAVPVLTHLLQATGCQALELFMHPRQGGAGDTPAALLAGNREQRWQAGQILAAFAAGMDDKKPKGLPTCLSGECRILSVPKAMMGELLGKAMANLVKLMESTDTFIFPVSQQAHKNEMDDLLNVMFDGQKKQQQMNDIAIFGLPMARLSAEVKIMTRVEASTPGHYALPEGQTEVIDPAEGLGIDRVWMSQELEDEEGSSRRANTLAGAAACTVLTQRKLLLVAGPRGARDRAREYLSLSTARRFGNKVPAVQERRDAVVLQVPQDVVQNVWLLQQLDKISLDTKTIIFYEGAAAPEGSWDRLVVMGAVLERRGKVVGDALQQVKSLIEKAAVWTKKGWDLSRESGLQPMDQDPVEKDENQTGKGQSGEKGGKGEKGEKGGKGKGKDGPAAQGKGDKDQGKGKGKGKGKSWEFSTDTAEDDGQGKGKAKGKGKGKKGKYKSKLKGPGEEEPVTYEAPSEPVLKAAPSTPAPSMVKRSASAEGIPAPVSPTAKKPKTDVQAAMANFKGAPPPKAAVVMASPAPAPAPAAAAAPVAGDPPAPKLGAKGAPPPAAARVRAAPEAALVTSQKSEEATRPPQTPAGPPPPTPAARATAPQTPAGPPPPTPGNAPPPAAARVGAPQTPAGPPPASARVGSAQPQTPSGPPPPSARVASTPPPTQSTAPAPPVSAAPAASAVPAPQTPAGPAVRGAGAGVPAPRTPASSPTAVPAPHTPTIGGIAAPHTPTLGGVAAPQTPAKAPPASARVSASASGAPAAPAPAVAVDPDHPDSVVPMTPARPSTNMVPQTPAMPAPSPHTPAAITRSTSGRLGGRANAPPPASAAVNPGTPAAISGRVTSAAPATPAAIRGAPPPSSAAVGMNPSTPAAIAGRAASAAPATPAAITGRAARSSAPAPATPATITGGAMANPATPAAITGKLATRGAPVTPAAIAGGASKTAPRSP